MQLVFLRPVMPDDEMAIYNHFQNPAIAANLLQIPYPYTPEEAKKFMAFVAEGRINKTNVIWAIVSRETNLLLGLIGAHIKDGITTEVEIGYWIGYDYWNRGIASSAISELCKIAYDEMGVNKIYARVFEHNIASKKALLKNGFVANESRNLWIEKGNEKIFTLVFERLKEK